MEWVKQLGGSNSELSTDILIDNAGNIYAFGVFRDSSDFNPGTGIYTLSSFPGVYNSYILKLDNNGDFLWAKKIFGNNQEAAAMALDNTGSIYLAGDFSGTCDFDPGDDTISVSAVGSYDIFILKLDNNGNFVWVNTVGGSDFDNILEIHYDNNSGIYFGGKFEGVSDFDPGTGIFNLTSTAGLNAFVAKIDTSGNFNWAKQIEGADTESTFAISTDTTENIYIGGKFDGTPDFDPGPGVFNLTASGTYDDLFLLKLDNNGNFLWAVNSGISINASLYDIKINNANELLVSGSFSGQGDFNFGPGNYTLNSTGSSDGFIIKMDLNANLFWVKQFGNTGVCLVDEIISDDFNSIYLNGNFSGTIDFNPNAGVSNLTSNGQRDIFILKLDNNGNLIWNSRFGGSNYDWDKGISINQQGDVFSIGEFSAIVDADPGQGIYNLYPFGQFDFYIEKFNQKRLSGMVFNDINENCIKEANEVGLAGRWILINPGNYIAQTNTNGIWSIDSLPVGNYTIYADTIGNWEATCPITQNFSIGSATDIIIAPGFGFVSTMPCSDPEISVYAPFMRRCFTDQKIYLRACNSNFATGSTLR